MGNALKRVQTLRTRFSGFWNANSGLPAHQHPPCMQNCDGHPTLIVGFAKAAEDVTIWLNEFTQSGIPANVPEAQRQQLQESGLLEALKGGSIAVEVPA